MKRQWVRSDEDRSHERESISAEIAQLQARLGAIAAEQDEVDRRRLAEQAEAAQRRLDEVRVRRDTAVIHRDRQQTVVARLAGGARDGSAIAAAERELLVAERILADRDAEVVEAGRALAGLRPEMSEEILRETDEGYARAARERDAFHRSQVEWASRQPNCGRGQVSDEIVQEAYQLAEERRASVASFGATRERPRGGIQRAEIVPANTRF